MSIVNSLMPPGIYVTKSTKTDRNLGATDFYCHWTLFIATLVTKGVHSRSGGLWRWSTSNNIHTSPSEWVELDLLLHGPKCTKIDRRHSTSWFCGSV